MDEYEEVRSIYNEIAELYHKKRQNADDSTWNDYLETPAINAMLEPLVKDRLVLDLGCGTGLLARAITDWGGHVRGVDFSPEMLRLARDLHPDIEFQQSRADRLPYADREFDVVASSLVMHYIKDLAPVFLEVSRVLKQGGRFVFSMHHPLSELLDTKSAAAEEKLMTNTYFNNDRYYWRMCGRDILSFHHTIEDIMHALKQAGFMLVDFIECRPDAALKGIFKDYEYTSQYPTFCVLDACRS